MDEVKPVARVPTVEHREPCESRGSRTVLGAPGGAIPPGDSTFASLDEPWRVVGHGSKFHEQFGMIIARLEGKGPRFAVFRTRWRCAVCRGQQTGPDMAD